MRIFCLAIIAAAFALSGCNPSETNEKRVIREAVAKFCADHPSGRSPGDVASHIFSTSKGTLEISTCQGRKHPGGDWYTEGPARADEYFIMPRGAWALNEGEAIRMLLEDFDKGNCIPNTPVTSKPASP